MRRYLALFILVLLSGCGINYVKQVSPGDVVANDRAVIVYGVKVEGQWGYPKFSILLDEYDAQTGKITGNCLVHTKTQATVDGAPGGVQYFAFDVPPGQYVYSPFNANLLYGGNVAFEAAAGKRTYVGEFVYEKNRAVTLRQNLGEAKASIDRLFPGLKGSLSPADTRTVKSPYIFICTP
ncbi:hypothetical protein [Duganella levis]|uniref:DUF2846 domain-containing protein n=1 Tax=Duganella levis TaxID=2692169 RepID=A0ABW9VU80_9BURK|nr:hypothetical protein [Duganella levis]MYN25187.1 hypothetical protein [Duganella levis]